LPVHAARHIGSFDVALGVGFLFAAWRPSRIPGLLPVVVALVVCLVGSSLLDVASGNTAALGEAQHVLDFVGLAVVWLLSRPSPRTVRLA
jgi:predicted anti-sigma-YlaC factor YlaD